MQHVNKLVSARRSPDGTLTPGAIATKMRPSVSETDLRSVQNFSQICSVVSGQMCNEQTDRQTEGQTANTYVFIRGSNNK